MWGCVSGLFLLHSFSPGSRCFPVQVVCNVAALCLLYFSFTKIHLCGVVQLSVYFVRGRIVCSVVLTDARSILVRARGCEG